MGAALDSFGTAVETLQRAPIIIAVSFGVMLVGLPAAMILGLIPIVGGVIGGVLTIVLYAGIIGMAYAGMHDGVTASFDAYKQAVSNKWKPIAGAYLILTLIQGVIAFVAIFGLFFVVGFGAAGAGAMAEGGSEFSAAALGTGFVALGLAVVALFMLFFAAIQFYDVAIVVGDYSASDSFGESIDLFREAPLSVLGYTFLRALAGTLPVMVPIIAGIALSEAAGLGETGLWIGLGIGALMYPLSIALAFTYHTAYYTTRRPETLQPKASEPRAEAEWDNADSGGEWGA